MVSENVPTAGARGAPKHGSALFCRVCWQGDAVVVVGSSPAYSTQEPRVRSLVMPAFAGDSIMESPVASHSAGCVSMTSSRPHCSTSCSLPRC